MIRILITVIVTVATLQGASAQWLYEDIPPAVESSFQNQFPEISSKDVDWDWESEGYEATFMQEGKKHKGYFDRLGNFISYEIQDLELDQLPHELTSSLSNSEYKDWQIEKSNVLFIGEDSFYEIEVKKGRHDERLFYSKNGIRIDQDTYEKGQM